MANPSSQAFEDTVDLQIGLLQAHLPRPGEDWRPYPFMPLEGTSGNEIRTFRTIILENSFVRVTVLPDLGGRILSLHDKRSGTEILRRFPMIEPQSGGRRGAYVREGIELWLDGQERLNSLGTVASQVELLAEDADAASVCLAETVTGTGLSFNLTLTLPSDRAELRIEARVLNRWLRPQPYNGGLSLYVGPGRFEGTAFYSTERDAGIGVFSEGQLFDGVQFDGERLRFERFDEPRMLAPRQVDTWTAILAPLSGLHGCLGASTAGGISLTDGVLRLQTTEPRMQHKLLMLTEDEKTLEAVVDLYPEHVLELPVEGLNPVEFVLLDPGKREVLRASGEPSIPKRNSTLQGFGRESESSIALDSDENELRRATFNISERHLAHTLLGMRALSSSNWSEAATEFDQALNFNAEDPLLWWAKAMTARIAEEDNEAELLNAHYLAPLEPALRAESFLGQTFNPDPEPNRLLAPLEDNPGEFIEVACLLIECGLFDQAARWLDEAIRHQDLPMLRYLTAYGLLVRANLAAEAAEQVRIAAKTPIGPPFPYRDIERIALAELAKAFPDDKAIATFTAYLD